MNVSLLRSSFLLLLVLQSFLSANAQTTNAGFTGVIKNEKGEAVTDATVTVKNESTGFSNSTRANARGELTDVSVRLRRLLFDTTRFAVEIVSQNGDSTKRVHRVGAFTSWVNAYVVAVDIATIGISPNARTFALRVRGDSMTGAHILNGDTIVLELKPPHDGAVVAALVDGESTLKRYSVRRGVPYLKADNPK